MQTHGIATGTKVVVAFVHIFMREIEKQILNECAHKPLAWKRYIDDIISLWHTSRDIVEKFVEKANKHHPTIKLTAEISCTDATFLDTTVYMGQRFNNESVLDMRNRSTSNQRSHSNTRSLQRVTHREQRKALSKVKH